MTKTKSDGLVRFFAALSLLAATACAAPEGEESVPLPSLRAPAIIEPEPEPCGAVFTPEPALLAETLDAAARWSAATGCDVRVGEDGIRVQLVDEIIVVDELGRSHATWGMQDWTETGEVIIYVTALRSAAVLPHEMGHALYTRSGHVEDGVSLMSFGGGTRITAADLIYVCAGFDCASFTPEPELLV